jgi:hypothetical protein
MEANAAREIIEELHEQLAVLRDQLQGARAREEFLQSLLTADRNLDRESRLLALLEADRRELRELQALRPQRHPSALTHEAAASPRTVQATAARHAQIVAALAECPGGLTRQQIEAQVGGTSLRHVLCGLARKGRVVRLGQGRFGLPVEVLAGAPSLNGIGA